MGAPFDYIPQLLRYELTGAVQREIRTPEQQRSYGYQSLLPQVSLLTLHLSYQSEISSHIANATVNIVDAQVSPATGHLEQVCSASVRVDRLQLVSLNLAAVEPLACFRSLGGQWVRQPPAFGSVQPLGSLKALQDAVRVTEDRPLLAMGPAEFELYVAELLRRMGPRLEHTGRGGDGGVDCVAVDDRAVVGGRIIVQVKRYSNTVPASVVRDL